MKNIKIIFLTLIITIIDLKADLRIITYLQNPPPKALNEAQIAFENEKNINKLEKLNQKTPLEISQKFVKNAFKQNLHLKLEGFTAIYSGYLDYSNENGLISFPLRHPSPKLYLVITPQIKLVRPKGNTISHREYVLLDNVSTKIYLYEKKQDQNQKYFWQVSEQPIPQNKRISPLAMVILTKPKNLYVPTGDFMSDDSKHIVLPNIYVTGNIDNIAILLNTMNLKLFFEPVNLEEKKINDLRFQEMITNL